MEAQDITTRVKSVLHDFSANMQKEEELLGLVIMFETKESIDMIQCGTATSVHMLHRYAIHKSGVKTLAQWHSFKALLFILGVLVGMNI